MAWMTRLPKSLREQNFWIADGRSVRKVFWSHGDIVGSHYCSGLVHSPPPEGKRELLGVSPSFSSSVFEFAKGMPLHIIWATQLLHTPEGVASMGERAKKSVRLSSVLCHVWLSALPLGQSFLCPTPAGNPPAPAGIPMDPTPVGVMSLRDGQVRLKKTRPPVNLRAEVRDSLDGCVSSS